MHSESATQVTDIIAMLLTSAWVGGDAGKNAINANHCCDFKLNFRV